MKPLPLHIVRKFTGRHMDYDEAVAYVSPRQPRQCIRNQAIALSLLTRLNTEEDWLRLEAALVILAATRNNIAWRRHKLLLEAYR